MYENEDISRQMDADAVNIPAIETINTNEYASDFAPAQPIADVYIPKKRRLSKGALTIYILIVALLYAVVVFLSVAVSNSKPHIEEHQIENSYMQTYEA